MNFSELGLNPFVLKSLETAGYADPTPVQAEAIPAALEGRDLLVSAQTGSGKTAAFLLPSLCRLAEPSAVPGQGPRILVLTPTRELALQVEKAALTYGAALRRIKTVSLVGGAPYGAQLRRLSQPIDVVVATPGRLMDHMERGKIDFSRLEVLVLDEADRMLDMGFIDDIQSIVAQTPESRQTLLFSATLDGVVGDLARQMTRDAQRIEVARTEDAEAQIAQKLHFFDDYGHKMRLLDVLVADVALNQAIVFTATKLGAEDLTAALRERGFPAEALHGDMQQNKRNRTLDRLRSGQTRFLVATDVAARGIDVAGISHVINFDLPRQAEDYVHRIGRTGRAGRAGVAITLVGPRERHVVRNIERYTGQSIAVEEIAGLEPTIRPRQERDGGGKPGRGGPKPWGDRQGNRFGGNFERGPRGGYGGGQGGGYRDGNGGYNNSHNNDYAPRFRDAGDGFDRDSREGREGREDRDAWQPGKDAWKNQQPQGYGGRGRGGFGGYSNGPKRAGPGGQPSGWKGEAWRSDAPRGSGGDRPQWADRTKHQPTPHHGQGWHSQPPRGEGGGDQGRGFNQGFGKGPSGSHSASKPPRSGKPRRSW
jgi:superfamily II DNA/RNA helicase